jgi:hypothetical protein
MGKFLQWKERRIKQMQEQKRNAGITVGIIASVIFLIIHVLIDMVNEGGTQGDFVLWFFQLLSYFFIGMIAGSSQHKNHADSNDPLYGIKEAGRGAAILISAILWVYIIIRSIALDDSGLFNSFGILFTLLFAVFDFLMALALGTFGAGIIHKKYDYEE